ncbi:MAG: MgtC/SapB family protein [Planctomycetes bacterium]|nr:MgtC/SapB family protein [Planctomycetota bacterium]
MVQVVPPPPEGLEDTARLLASFATALFIGALIGIDRERKQRDSREEAIGGLRTFIVLALLGAMAAWLARTLEQPWLFASVGGMVAALVVAGYVMHVRATPDSPGITTEVAALATYVLGGMALYGRAELAVALAIAITAALAWKEPLHGLVGRIETTELYAGLQLLIATFIVLPILPDRTLDPWNALNPYEVWVLAILISALSLSGYVASRWLGPRRGTLLTGLFGGLVSSTAVTLAFSRRSREEPDASLGALATGLAIAWTVMFARIVVETALVHRPLVARVAVGMLAMGLAAGVCATVSFRVHAREPAGGHAETLSLANPFRLTAAIRFAALFAAVLVVVAIVRENLPPSGVYLAAAIAGLTDVDAITLSLSRQAREGLDPDLAVRAITLAALTNTLVKLGLVVFLGSAALRRRVSWIALATLAAGAVAVWFQ